jgi:segregation and condensation protein B
LPDALAVSETDPETGNAYRIPDLCMILIPLEIGFAQDSAVSPLLTSKTPDFRRLTLLPVPYLRCLFNKMSLKTKLEAVIYAAEEPVTLAQFAFLFAEDALAWKAERDALNAETALEGRAASESDEVAPSEAATPEAEAVETAAAEQVVDFEAEARRTQRQREREVREILRGILDELIAEYAQDSRGIEIREIAGGFRMGTKPEIHDAVRSFVKSLKPPMKLSLPALETLAVIAYKQPVTAPEVGDIRGVDSAGVLGSLMSRKLIATAGRKQVIGRPMLYKTTREFLLRFGLKDLNELPSMEEFEKMAALELSEGEDEDGSSDVIESGDLFAESETATVPIRNSVDLETDAPDVLAENGLAQVDTAVTTPTAEPSNEAAEAQAPVERLDAEEVEAEV